MTDLTVIVQRMIDAGEPEENIASVIRASKSVPATPADPGHIAPGAAVPNLQAAYPELAVAFQKYGPGQFMEGVRHILGGELAKGGHEAIQGAMVTAAPIVAPAVVAAPGAAAAMGATGWIGQHLGQAVASGLGASDDQATLAGDVAGIGAGGLASKAIGAVSEMPTPSKSQLLRAAKVIKNPAREGLKAGIDALADVVIKRLESSPSSASASSAPVLAEAATPTATLTRPKDFNPGKALTAVRGVFAAIKETPRPAEVSNAMEQMRIGRTAEDAVKQILESRPMPPTTPAEAFAARFNLPSNAQVQDAVAKRNATGRWDR